MNRLQYAYVNEDGSLVIPADVAARYGFTPGQRAVLEEGRRAVLLKRPAATLAYVRRTYQQVHPRLAPYICAASGTSRSHG